MFRYFPLHFAEFAPPFLFFFFFPLAICLLRRLFSHPRIRSLNFPIAPAPSGLAGAHREPEVSHSGEGKIKKTRPCDGGLPDRDKWARGNLRDCQSPPADATESSNFESAWAVRSRAPRPQVQVGPGGEWRGRVRSGQAWAAATLGSSRKKFQRLVLYRIRTSGCPFIAHFSQEDPYLLSMRYLSRLSSPAG